jgi:ABC-type multidrug transport system fused ATPase/permease subunit
MATFEDENKKRSELKEALETICTFTIDSLIRKEDLGARLNFEEGLPYFKRIIGLFQDLRDSDLNNIPFSVLETLLSHARNALDFFNRIKNFGSPQLPQSPEQDRKNFLNELKQKYDSYFGNIALVLAFTRSYRRDIESLEIKAKEILKNLQNIVKEVVSLKDKFQADANKILESLRSAAAEAGVSQHSIFFHNEAEFHQKASKKWLITTTIIIAITLGCAIWSISYYYNLDTDLSNTRIISISIAKLIAFSILYFAIIWSSKNYRAHRHNFVVNKHRQNALSTFQAFVNATGGDESTKNAVLLRSTEAIFSPVATGYLSQESEPSGTPQIVEIFKNALEKNK